MQHVLSTFHVGTPLCVLLLPCFAPVIRSDLTRMVDLERACGLPNYFPVYLTAVVPLGIGSASSKRNRFLHCLRVQAHAPPISRFGIFVFVRLPVMCAPFLFQCLCCETFRPRARACTPTTRRKLSRPRPPQQNAQLKDFLRRHHLLVSGKKEVLVNRLLQAARDCGHLPQDPPSSPAGSDFSFSLPGLDPTSADAADTHRGPERNNEGAAVAAGVSERSGGEDDARGSGKKNAAGGDRVGGESRPSVAAVAAAAAAGKPKTTLKERLEARVRDRDLAAKRQADETPPPSSAPKSGPNGAVGSASSGNGSNSGGSSSRKHQGCPTTTISGRERPSAATQGKHRPVSSQPRTANEAGTTTAKTSAMGPPRVRKALGSLGSGNVGAGSGDGRPTGRPAGTKAAVVKQKSPTVATQVGATKSQQLIAGGGASAEQKRGHGATSGSSGRRVVKTARTSVVAGSSGNSSASRTGTMDRVGSSFDAGKSKEGRNSSSGSGKRPVQPGAVTAAGSAASHKRAKVDGGGGGGGLKTASTKASALASKSAKPSSGGAPSFMKPTKTSGARNVGPEE